MGYSLAIDMKYQVEAYSLINKFRAINDPIVTGVKNTFGFSQIEIYEVVEQLLKRVENPSTIDQGGVNLCGPAAVMFCWLCKRPDLYVQYVVNVYERGTGRMGSLFVRPGEDCRNHKPKKIASVDWIALAALRDSENSYLDIDSEPNYFGAVTMPDDIVKWFNNIGFKALEHRTAAMCNEGYETLRNAVLHLKEGCCVCLLVNATKLFGGDWWDLNLTANHWIVMTSEPKINGMSVLSLPSENGLLDKPVDIDVYTWGEIRSLHMFLDDFLDGFYGFIAAQYDDNSAFARKLSLLSEFGKNFP